MKYFIDYLPSHVKLYRFEEFEESMKIILKKVDCDAIIPHQNQLVKPDYQKEYSDKSMEIIGKYYKWDLDNLNYTFNSYGKLPLINEIGDKL